MKKQLLILITLFTVTIGYSQTFTDNFITYEVIPSTTNVTITDYDYTNGGAIVNIPATVDYSSVTYNVTHIGNNAFQGNVSTGDQITSVTIPNSVTIIGTSAFSYNLLSSVVIPNTITSIGISAFGFNLLESITIPSGVTSIGAHAFRNNDLTSITISSSVISIGSSAFRNNDLTSVTIPSGVTSILPNAFSGNPLTCVISEATIPPTIITNGPSGSFNSINSGINLTIPTGTIAAYVTDAGALWTGFGSVAEGFSATFIVDNITYQILPNPNNEVTVTDYNTAGGTAVTIPTSVNSACTDFSVVDIGVSAFQSKSLMSVTIPNSVTNIDAGAFALNNLTSVIIPNSVTNIGIGAFAGNNLTIVTIPSNVTSIGHSAFLNNPLTDVFSESTTPPTIITGGSTDTFAVNRSAIHLQIPTGTMGAYVTDAGALWTGFNPVTEGALSTSDFELANDITVITTADELKVTYSNNITLQNYAVYNMFGGKVSTGINNRIPTTFLASGVYILKLDFDKGIVTKKIIVN
ncbi:MAG: leucine-rich repeat domain-containing protein [Flavobacteriaceae bacterium]|nr:leucine-rich repeat domain-containing protein [Flavobacteriaceae bacterium]